MSARRLRRVLVSGDWSIGVTRAAIAAFCSVVLVAGCGGNAAKQSGTASTANATSTAKAADPTSTANAADTTPAQTTADASSSNATTKHRAPAKGTRVTV